MKNQQALEILWWTEELQMKPGGCLDRMSETDLRPPVVGCGRIIFFA